MAEISEGWDGTVDAAAMARIIAATAPRRIYSGFDVTAVAGMRRVLISAGESTHGFIRYERTDPQTIDFPAPVAAGQWHLLVQRREWATKSVTTFAIPSITTTTDLPGPPPNYPFPAAFADLPGVSCDFPLRWVWVRSTDNLVITRRVVPFTASAAGEWAMKSGPLSRPGAPGGEYANQWAKHLDSGGSIDGYTDPIRIKIGQDGIYDVVAKQRVNGSTPGAAYICLAVNGSRTTLETRDNGAWFHDHGSTMYSSSESRYIGPLYAGESITAGPNAGGFAGMLYSSAGLNGGIWLRRIS